MVGTQTVIDDNPQLNARDWEGNNPIRIVIDQRNRIPKTAHIWDNKIKTIVFSNEKIEYEDEDNMLVYVFYNSNIDNNLKNIIKEKYKVFKENIRCEKNSKNLNINE